MARIRVIRLMEYAYDSVEAMEQDIANWAVQGVRRFNSRCTIRSITLPLEVLEESRNLDLRETQADGS